MLLNYDELTSGANGDWSVTVTQEFTAPYRVKQQSNEAFLSDCSLLTTSLDEKWQIKMLASSKS